MRELNLGYIDLENMPMEYIEWFYDRQLQYTIDLKNKKNNGS